MVAQNLTNLFKNYNQAKNQKNVTGKIYQRFFDLKQNSFVF